MKLPLKELQRFCSLGIPQEELVERLVMTGTEIEAVHRLGPPSMEGYVVGHVISVEKHPDADRLNVCQVDTGDGEPRTIVCGAKNVAAGQVVAVVLPGAVMPDGMKIKKAKLRGVTSNGMICSEAELGISTESKGIMVLAEAKDLEAPGTFPDQWRPGRPLQEVLDICDTVLELEVTPNRSDCFGVYGLAREIGAVTGAPLFDPPWLKDAEAEGSEPVEKLASITVEVPELCPRFTARVFTDVEIGPSPLWLKQSLTAMGQRPINNVVDITNYVMLVTGQPLHAFDLDKVAEGGLIIRRAGAGEKVATLDGVERELDEDIVVVADREGPSAIAGIMGGARSEVSESTTRVLLEVANWDGPNILASSRRLGLRSEASSRFERRLHPALCDRAQAMASSLLSELCGAKMAPGTLDVAVEMPQHRAIEFDLDSVGRLLGIEIDRDEAIRHLSNLGLLGESGHVFQGSMPVIHGSTEDAGRDSGGEDQGRILVQVPPDRYFDLTRPADLIEEIGRLHGYENLPATLPATGRPGGLSREQRLRRSAEDMLRYQGFDEVVGWSFTDPAEGQRLQLGSVEAVRLSNPLSEDQSVMRTTLLGSLLDAAAYNVSRGAEAVSLFESGRVYLPLAENQERASFPGRVSPAVDEPHRIAALSVGHLRRAGWDGSGEAQGFFALKGVLEALAVRLRVELGSATASKWGFLHPGRAAEVRIAGRQDVVGWIGELHPGVLAAWDLPDGVAFELDLAPLLEVASAGEEIYADVTSFPAVRQDLAIVLPDGVSAAEVEARVRDAGGDLLTATRIFDLYRGEQIGEGNKSLALSLEFQAPDRTLTESEVAELRAAIESALAEIGGAVRG